MEASKPAPQLIRHKTSRSARANRWINGESLLAFAFILPSLIGFIIFFAIPIVRGISISFTEWNLIREPKFVGFDNYAKLFEDRDFWNAMTVTFQYVSFNIPLQTVLALFIAVVMDKIQSSTWLRGIFVLPWLIPNVIVALLWLWILDPNLGIIQDFLALLRISHQSFLGSPDQAIASIAGINIWRYTGYTALLLFAGLKTIPRTLYEAAQIDGAGEFAMFQHITLPLLRPVLAFVLVTSVVGSFQIFDTIAVTTQGGPIKATRVIYWYIFEHAFERFNMGYAAAIASVLFVILVVVTIIQFRFFRGNRSDLAEYS
jgi:multiple sugar transport system permease protein